MKPLTRSEQVLKEALVTPKTKEELTTLAGDYNLLMVRMSALRKKGVNIKRVVHYVIDE